MSISDMPDYAATSPVNAAQPGGGVDVRAMMMFEANKTEVCVAYLLWFFLGYFGAHNFYLKRTGVAVAQLILTLTLIGMLVVFFWHLVDAFLIPSWVRRNNNALALRLGAAPFYGR